MQEQKEEESNKTKDILQQQKQYDIYKNSPIQLNQSQIKFLKRTEYLYNNQINKKQMCLQIGKMFLLHNNIQQIFNPLDDGYQFLQNPISLIYRTSSNISSFQKQTLNLSSFQYPKVNTQKFLSYIRATRIKVLFIHQKNLKSINNMNLKQISFLNLQKLSLYGSNIVSIQRISQVYMPFLNSLYLYENQIVYIKNIFQTNFKNLTLLSLYDNKFNDLQGINNFYVPYLQIQMLNPYQSYYYNKRNNIKFNNLDWLIKLQSLQLPSYYSNYNLIISKNKKFMLKIEQKFSQKVQNLV